MITGKLVGLRPYAPRDAEDLERLFSDLDTHLSVSPTAHIPRSADAIRRRLERDLDGEPDPNKDVFLVAAAPREGGAFIGAAAIWGIDGFNRLARLGVALLPDARKRGYGTDIINTLCFYCFWMRDLRRVELETHATNAAMCRTAAACGFTEEGRARERHYNGQGHVDVSTFGLLRSEWLAAPTIAVVGHGGAPLTRTTPSPPVPTTPAADDPAGPAARTTGTFACAGSENTRAFGLRDREGDRAPSPHRTRNERPHWSNAQASSSMRLHPNGSTASPP